MARTHNEHGEHNVEQAGEVAAPSYNDADYVFTVAGRKITVAPRFAEGHVLTATEAAVLDKAALSNAVKSLESGYSRGTRGKDFSEDQIRADMTNYLNAEYKPEAPQTRTVADYRRMAASAVIRARLEAAGKPTDDATVEKTTGNAMTAYANGSLKADIREAIDAALHADMLKVEAKAPRAKASDAAEVDLDAL